MKHLHTSLIDHGDDDWLNDTEEQMQAEDDLWEAAYSRHHDQFDALAEAALTEIEAGTTQPMFDEQGEFIINELSHHCMGQTSKACPDFGGGPETFEVFSGRFAYNLGQTTHHPTIPPNPKPLSHGKV